MFGIKTILTLTDMSDHSKVVMEAAMLMARQFDARLLVYHASPNLSGDEQLNELRKGFEKMMNDLESDLNFSLNSSQVMVATENFPSGKLLTQVVTDADIVVIGGCKPNRNEDCDNVSKVIEMCNQPVMIIPGESKLSAIQQILYCTSYEDLDSNEPLEVVKLIASEFGSEVRVAHVKTHHSKPNKDHVERSRMEGVFFEPEVRYSYKLIRNSDVIDGLNQYIKKKGDNDLVVMVRRKHRILERIFGKNFTFRMLQDTEVPLLILKEPQLN